MKATLLISAICAMTGLAACSGSDGDEPGLTKDEARRTGGKGDHNVDYCDLFGWYGDGVCDDFCPRTDEDCNTVRTCGGHLGLSCGEDEFCSYTREAICGAGDQTGICTTTPEVCTQEYMPVCGCDGQTYSNECTANGNGTSVASDGSCAPQCETDEDCPQLVCIPEGPCPQTRCIEGECRTPDAPCGGIAGLTCDADEYCDYDAGQMCGAADQMGVCRTRPEVCTEEYDPVCGCDGETYSNECFAHSSGVDESAEGECAAASDCRTDGCSDGRYCSYCWGSWACIPDGAVC